MEEGRKLTKHRTRVGLHARNTVIFPEHDYELIRQSRIETLKMLSIVDPSVYARLRQEHPDIEFIVRLYDDRLNRDSRPSPAQFVARMVPIVNRLKPYADKFEIHNEPNHVQGIEGWGPSDDSARSFRSWYMQVLSALKSACPWAQFGFPGLALNYPHRDLAWLDICRDAIQASDWLGCHCYWQYDNMMSDNWGLRFKLYRQRFPEIPIEITEFGNSTPNLPREEMARQYVRYYQELNKYPYLGSANSFIASTPDPAWVGFVWMKEGGEMMPVVHSVGNMDRRSVEIPEPQELPPKPKPIEPTPTKRTIPQTGKTIRGQFLEFYDQYSLDICGYPITEQFEEQGLQSQYFQRLALEELQSGGIQLKLVGTEAWTSRPMIAQLKTRLQEFSQLFLAFGPAKPPVEDIVDDLPTHATHRYDTRSLADISQIVIHHTATSPSVTPERLAQYQVHKQERAGIIYHFVVTADGIIYQTNRLETVSHHAYSRSESSIGICFPGNFTDTIPPAAQLEAGGQLCAWLVSALRLPTSAVVGLSEFAATQSPGKQWLSGKRWKDKLLEQVEAALGSTRDDQAALIASLEAQNRTLSGGIAERQQQPPSPSAVSFSIPEPPQIGEPPTTNLIDELIKHETKTYRTRALSDIRHLVIHHSAAPPSVGPRRIASYHVKTKGWPGIGYHFLISDKGTIYQGNTLETISNHAVQANSRGVGICFLGNFTKVVPPPAQLRAGAHLVAWLMQELNISPESVKGHREFMETACPGDQWLTGKKWKQMLRQEIAQVQQEVAEPSVEKPLYHYMLFWARNGEWAETDWLNAQNYIGAYRPTAGFSADEASLAQYVTIVGGPAGVPRQVEAQLEAAGCKVDRIEGKDEAETKKILDELAQDGRRFQSLEE
jgi:N-acetyl-anhydromuramyl-L-alanine amidase AmpD